jgi:tRNA (guanine-N7-)-methyltransferase
MNIIPTDDATESVNTVMRRVRSFVLRQGRMTVGQRRMLEQHWQCFGVERQAGVLDFNLLFGRPATPIVEIGFGMGRTLAQMAKANVQQDYLGIEVHLPGVASLLRDLDDEAIGNVRVIRDDAVEVLQHNIAPDSLAAVHLYFPDPWPKRRHHKRRIVQPAFVNLMASRLQPGGIFHMATDWEDYARQAMAVLSNCPVLINCAGELQFSPRPEHRPLTKFEQRGQRLGHGVWDLLFRRID